MAIFLLKGRGASLLAGYNTMSYDERARYDEKAMCRFAGRLLIGICFGMLLFPIGIHFEAMWMTLLGIAVIVLGSVGAVVYMNTGNRFKRKDGGEVKLINLKTTSKHNRPVMIISTVFSVIVLVVVGIMLIYGGRDTEVYVTDNVVINAMYGLSIEFSDITDVALIDKSMNEIGAGRRTNGASVGGALKGHFKSETNGDMLLFVEAGSSPTIRIERNDEKTVYISFKIGADTEQLYNSLIIAVK